ncbi:response regulator [Oxalobacteraceae bacterium OM1]|nr:response regulator [Oxalobacteraceae bacterium OM1]
MEHRILIYTPTGKDGKLVSKVLEHSNLECHVCPNAGEIIHELGKGAGGILIADEALTTDFLRSLTQYLKQQQAWSDLPILVLSRRGLDSPDMRNIYLKLGNVTLLERPVQSVTLVSAATSALRGRKRQYEMREVDRRKDEFLAMLAHELRNPLAPISAASDLLGFAQLDHARVRQTSEVISRQVRHMTSLIDDLLDVSRVSRGLVSLERSQLDARQIVSHAVEQVRPLIDARRHRLTVQTPPDPAVIHGDKKRLIQVVTNLLNNAAKYSPEGGNILLTVDVDHETVILRVVDDGIGMTPDVIECVFEMFTQAERTLDRSQGGLGIGLALVRSLVEMHGGTVAASSDGIGRGSQFAVILPRIAESKPVHEANEQGGKVAATAGRRLLLVDDNVDAARMLAMLLESAGHAVLVEHSARSALERARAERPSVCLLDIGLPEMSGNELARQLRSQPETGQSILIAITGYGQEQDKRATAAAGFDHHFVKPVDTAHLLHLLATLP